MSAVLNMTDAPIKATGTSDSSHYYAHTADRGWYPLYTPEKNYTLREARKDKAAGMVVVPSVTTIFKVLAKPQLVKWQMEQVAKACWIQAFTGYEQHEWRMVQDWINGDDSAESTFDRWVEEAIATANNSSKGAMDLGTRIHQAIEDCIAGRDYDADLKLYVMAVMAKRAELGIRWSEVEACVGSTKFGYAGRCDDNSKETLCVRDYKSRKSKGKKVPTYETDFLQISAYGHALFGNEFFKKGSGEVWGISTTEPGVLTVTTKTGAEMIEDFACFLALTKVWAHMNSFDARVKE
jgi:hypothetical protein